LLDHIRSTRNANIAIARRLPSQLKSKFPATDQVVTSRVLYRLTPGQYSSGGKARLGRITKAGDNYLRSLLVTGARAVLNSLGDKQDRFSRWARALVARRGYRRAVIAIAAKNARLAWAVLKYGEDFRLDSGKA
jgi:transposase